MRWLLGLCVVAACTPVVAPPPMPAPTPPSTVLIPPQPPPPPTPSAPPTEPAPTAESSPLARISVQERLPELFAEHDENRGYGFIRYDLAVRAVDALEPDMVVTFVGSAEPVRPVALFTLEDMGAFMAWPDPDVSQGGLRAFGIETWFGYAPSDTSYVLYVKGEAPALAPGTPGLVWQVDSAKVLFLSLDGETYEVPRDDGRPPLRLGAPPSDDWPPFDPEFGRMAFATTRRGPSPALSQRDQAFERCASFIWDATKRAMTPAQREQAHAPDSAVIVKSCAATIRAWEEVLAESIRASSLERQKLRDRAQERIGGR